MSTAVAVVGGGVIGCAIARALAPDHDVHVVERGEVAGGATKRGAGEITMTPSYTDRPAIAEYANEFFRKYDGTGAFRFVEAESVELVPGGRRGEARRRASRLSGEGFDVSFLDADASEAAYPRFDLDGYVGAVRHGDTGFVDPLALATTLREDAEESGATFETGTAVTDVDVRRGTVRGVRTADGRVPADVVVAAAGWRTADLLTEHLELPVRPYRTQCVVLRPESGLTDDFPMGWIPGEHVYFRRTTGGDLLVGGWSFPEDDPEGASRDSDEAFERHVADVVPTFLSGFDDAEFVDGWAGVDGATPDTRPILDAPSNAPDGLVVATGFHGRGIMTAPVAAAVVRGLVTGEGVSLPVEPFRLDRFDSRSRDFEFTSISDGDY